MSIESAKEFIERMKTDTEFARQVGSQKNKEARIKFVLDQGFNFSEQELKEVREEIPDEELDRVAGGFICFLMGCKYEYI